MCADGKQSFLQPTPPEELYEEAERRKKEKAQLVCPHCHKIMLRHVVCEGSRFHVTRWDSLGARCSEKDCEQNHGVGKCIPKEPKKERKAMENYMTILEDTVR
jgi:hypothetical protein